MMYIMLFLKGVDPGFSALQQLTSQGSLPSIDEVFSCIQQCTSHKNVQSLLETSAMVIQSAQAGCGHGQCCLSSGGGQNAGRGGLRSLQQIWAKDWYFLFSSPGTSSQQPPCFTDICRCSI